MNEFLSNGGLALIFLGVLLIGTIVTLIACDKKSDQMVEPRGYFKINTCIKKEPKTIKPNFIPKPLKNSKNKINITIYTCRFVMRI